MSDNREFIEIKVEDVREGDQFVSGGKLYWTAISNAEIVTSRTKEPLIHIRVRHVDGGQDDRYWDRGVEMGVMR